MPSPALAGSTPAHPYASIDSAREMGFRLCIDQLRKTLLTTPLGWLFVAWLAWGAVPHERLLAWLGLCVPAWVLGQAVLGHMARRAVTIAHDGWLLYLVAALEGLAWGASLLLLATQERIHLWLIVVLFGVTAIVAQAFMSHIRAYRAHSMAIYLMVCASSLYLFPGTALGSAELMLGMGIFMVMIHVYMQQISTRIIHGLQLQLENTALTEQLRDALRVAKRDATTDALTGLANRRVLDSTLATWQSRIATSARQLSVLMVDLDHFKRVNDTHGHDIGDRVLQAFAEHVRRLLRSQDLFARHGGEEFVILLPDTSAEMASTIGDRIRISLEGTRLLNDPPICVTVSIGVAQHQGMESIDATLARADAAAYSAKNLGRNKVQMAA